MDVILLEKVQNVGNLGEQVKVKSGFGRNFLIPQGKAVPATPENVAEFEARRAELEKAAAEQLAGAQARAEQLAGISLTLTHKAGDEGKLFGSITAAEVAEAITTQGVEVAKSEVRMPEGPIRQTGEYEIGVHLHTDVDKTITLTVEAE